MTDQTPSPSALYQRANRLKKKLKAQEEKDIIEKRLIAQADKIKKLKQTRKRQQIDIESDDWGNDIGVEFDRTKDDLGLTKQSNKVKPQYPEQKDEYNYNFWGDASSTQPAINPLSKIPYQKQLSLMFGDSRCED